jgi:hypothetical protein
MPGHVDTPRKDGRNATGKGIKWFGILYDEYTPAVEGQLLRDCHSHQRRAAQVPQPDHCL